jgi:hypothetical protein
MLIIEEEEETPSQVLAAHTYNPTLLEGSNQENQGSKPAKANSS